MENTEGCTNCRTDPVQAQSCPDQDMESIYRADLTRCKTVVGTPGGPLREPVTLSLEIGQYTVKAATGLRKASRSFGKRCCRRPSKGHRRRGNDDESCRAHPLRDLEEELRRETGTHEARGEVIGFAEVRQRQGTAQQRVRPRSHRTGAFAGNERRSTEPFPLLTRACDCGDIRSSTWSSLRRIHLS